MDLFEQSRQRQIEKESPLANRMRPRTLDEYVGQSHIIGKGRLLRRAIEADQLSSVIFFGPPGTGKTTLANVIANTTKSHFITLNAVLAGVKQVREAIADANELRNLYNRRTTLFVDEVQRWNKAQQDALLPHVERGTILLIGATTENPYFEVNKALVSRSRIFQLKPLTEEDLRNIARQAIEDRERGYGHLDIHIEENALDHLVNVANGDARGVLNALELAIETTSADSANRIVITLDVAEESIQRRAVLYDKDGDAHYDTISAFIKSLRGSDPDAALYWAAKMIYAGEDARFIFRRMGIFAGEDIGMADPNAMTVVNSCWSMYERVGMPEGQFPLTTAVIYCATAPKSNTSFAFFDALKVVKEEREAEVPNHIKDKNRDGDGFGHGVGYKYPHSYQDHWVAQQYLPTALQGKLFYQPSDQGYEGTIRDKVARRRELQIAAMLDGEFDSGDAEILTSSPKSKGREMWLQRTIANAGATLGQIRERVFELAKVQRHYLVLDMNAGSGLLLWEAVRHAPEGGVWGVEAGQSAETLRQQAKKMPELERPTLVADLVDEQLSGLAFDRVIGRNLLTRLREQTILQIVPSLLAEDGMLILAQVIPSMGQRLHALVDWAELADYSADVRSAEETIWADETNSLVNWNSADLATTLRTAGFTIQTLETQQITEQRRITTAQLRRWFGKSSYAQALTAAGFKSAELKRIEALYRRQLENRTVNWQTTVAFVVALRR